VAAQILAPQRIETDPLRRPQMKRSAVYVLAASLFVGTSAFAAGDAMKAARANAEAKIARDGGNRGHDNRGNDSRGHDNRGHESHGNDNRGHDNRGHAAPSYDRRNDYGSDNRNDRRYDTNRNDNRNDHRYDTNRNDWNRNNYNGHSNGHGDNRGWTTYRNDWNRHPNYWDNRRHDRNDYARYRYHYGYYNAPRGYYYRTWHRGDRLPYAYYGHSYVVYDWQPYRLYAPPYGYHWVRVGDDVVLTAIATGIVLDVLYNIWY